MRDEPVLKVGEIVAAQRDIVGKVERAGGGLLRRGAPLGPQFRAPALDVVSKRLNFGEEAAQFVDLFTGFGRHERPCRMREPSEGSQRFVTPDRSLTP